jgi:hypothetical protein
MAAVPSDVPVDGGELRRATADDAAELLVLQRCCWVDEAIANDTLDIPALHESLDDVLAWLADWPTWCVRVDGRLVGAVRTVHHGLAGFVRRGRRLPLGIGVSPAVARTAAPGLRHRCRCRGRLR